MHWARSYASRQFDSAMDSRSAMHSICKENVGIRAFFNTRNNQRFAWIRRLTAQDLVCLQ